MCGRIYIIYLLGSILIFSSCSGGNDETFVNLDISLVNIDGNEYISREKAVLIDNGSVFSTKLFSINGDLSIDLVVYFKNKIMDINNSCLQPILICYSQNNKYYQFSIIDGKAKMCIRDRCNGIYTHTIHINADIYLYLPVNGLLNIP